MLAIFDVIGMVDNLVVPPKFIKIDTSDFAATINKIDARDIPYKEVESVGGFTRTFNYDPEFVKLANSGGDLVDQALTYLAEPEHNPLQRRIAIHAIHKVPVLEWVRFANVMLDSYDKNQIDIWELEDTIFPRRFYSQHPTDDFWRPGVRHVLYRLYFAHDIDRFDENIKPRVIECLTGLDTLLYLLFYCPRCA